MLYARSLILAAALAGGAVPLASQAVAKPALQPPLSLTSADSARFLSLGQKYTKWLLGGSADSLVAAMDPRSAESMGGVEGVRTRQDQLAERAGIETKIVEEKLTRRNGRLQFWHAGEFSEISGDQFVIRWLLDENGKIIGAGLGPKAQTPPVD